MMEDFNISNNSYYNNKIKKNEIVSNIMKIIWAVWSHREGYIRTLSIKQSTRTSMWNHCLLAFIKYVMKSDQSCFKTELILFMSYFFFVYKMNFQNNWYILTTT